ncbi:MAG: hypothetical protein QF847_08270 [Candidatus Marinimicrobia bacterium]|jgi:hypothetical protein|nr:hypothetical protein [Candidatus Neomarinimicrobiota bacterium]MDP6727222.1 hypothetical protein [Candidatus Neomarinimicrobiota bacterium]|tara:strand:- start:1085 stop:1855 length:771 start_codon:yes stop_codon:yes gene_type:complete
MKKIILIAALLSQALSQGEWLSGTAHTLSQGRWEFGLFQPVRWGQAEGREVSFYKLTAFLMPGATVKQRWLQRYDWTISSSHSVYYPTPLLKMVTKPGIGGMISPEFDIPNMVSVWNMVLASKQLNNDKILTVKAGMALASGGSDLAVESTIDLPLIYHRLAVYYNNWLLRFGSDMNSRLSEKWTYLVDSDLFIIPGMKGSFALEHKGMVTWEKSSRFHISLGYKMVYGQYPDGYPNENITRLHILPMIDFVWSRE